MRFSRTRVYIFSLALVACFGLFHVRQRICHNQVYDSCKSLTVSTAYGSLQVSEPVILELLQTEAMQRLKHINQYGIMAIVKPEQKYTRYQHSLGVFYLLRTFGASLEEQIAGLLHDVSHTAFSHVADFVHGTHLNKYSYQDSIFSWYLEKTGLLAILQKHGFERVARFGNDVEYKMLKDDLPNLCADRLEYNLYGGYLEGWITQREMRELLSHVMYKDGQWVFDDVAAARKYAEISIDLSVQNWSSAENAFLSTRTAQLLKHGFQTGIITHEDFHFSTDAKIWKKITNSKDQRVRELLASIYNHKESYGPGTQEKHDLYFKGKFRGIDPLVLQGEKVVTLSQLEPSFKEYMLAQHAACREHYIAYLS